MTHQCPFLEIAIISSWFDLILRKCTPPTHTLHRAEIRRWSRRKLSKTSVKPIWISVKPANISFNPYQLPADPPIETVLERLPAAFELVGSSSENCNDKSEWLVLCKKEYANPPLSLDETRSCQADKVMSKSDGFRCWDCESMVIMAQNLPGSPIFECGLGLCDDCHIPNDEISITPF